MPRERTAKKLRTLRRKEARRQRREEQRSQGEFQQNANDYPDLPNCSELDDAVSMQSSYTLFSDEAVHRLFEWVEPEPSEVAEEERSLDLDRPLIEYDRAEEEEE